MRGKKKLMLVRKQQNLYLKVSKLKMRKSTPIVKFLDIQYLNTMVNRLRLHNLYHLMKKEPIESSPKIRTFIKPMSSTLKLSLQLVKYSKAKNKLSM